MVTCSQCGAQNDDAGIYCAKCAFHLQRAPQPSYAPQAYPQPSYQPAPAYTAPVSAVACQKCGGRHVNLQVVSTFKLRRGHGLLWWLFIGWWWMLFVFLFWIVAFIPMLIIRLIRGPKYRIKSKTHTEAVCQSCGHHWKVK